MSVEHKFTRRKPGEHPSETVLTITITGSHDIYRFAHMMLRGQVEFSERGRKIIAALKRRMCPGQWVYLDRSMGGWRMRGEREPREPSQESGDSGARAKRNTTNTQHSGCQPCKVEPQPIS